MAKTILEFEKPIVALEKKIEEMREVVNELDMHDEIDALEHKVDDLRRSV